MRSSCWLGWLALLFACQGGSGAEAPPDSTLADSTLADSTLADSTPVDSTLTDSTLTDAQRDEGPDAVAPTDSDHDGILDVDERLDGTDPLDPSSARAFHPERLADRPRLFFGPEDLGRLRRALASPSPGHAAILARLRARAEQAPPSHPPEDYSPTVAARRGEVAEALAFLALLEDDAQAAQAAAALVAAPFPDPSHLGLLSGYDLGESEALVAHCTAFDLLAAHPGLDPASLESARSGLLARLGTFRELCLEGALRPMVALSRNNHAMKVQGALGLCALTINEGAEVVADLHEAVTGLHHLLEVVQGTPGGGYAEGWNYLVYGGRTWLPFVVAYHRFARGEAFTYRAPGRSVFPYPLQGQDLDIPDLASPRLRSIFEQALRALRPDGLTPPTDDANPAALPGALLAALFEDPRFLWSWALEDRFATGGTEVASFALHTGEQGAPPSESPDHFAPEAGFAVLREDYGPEARYLLLLGEHGPARLNGFGHEHPDATSLLLEAFGESLLLDPGYINFDEHARVNTPQDHNLVLVDGEGPPVPNVLDVGVDAFLEGFEPDLLLSTLTVRARYRNVEVLRRVLRVRGEYFVVADHLEAPAPHQYTFQLHGHGGGTLGEDTFERLEDGARWMRPRAELRAYVAPTEGAAEWHTAEEEHQEGWGRFGTHRVARIEAEQGARAGFLALLLPLRAGQEAPPVRVERPAPGLVRAQVGEDTVLFNRGEATAEAPLGLTIRGADLERSWAR